jgi:SAM-dependent methyltransferase
MPFYRDHIYPHIVKGLGDPKPIRDVRERIVPLAEGTVLEIGVGPGVNFAHYNPAKVNKIYALEPNPGMIRLAEPQGHQTKLDVEFIDLPGERIPLNDETIDTVISTFTLCTIPGVVEAIRGIRRVLKPSGKFIFFEHGISPDPEVPTLAGTVRTIRHWAFEGCHLTRNIPALLAEGGFQIEQVEMAHLVPFPKAWTYCWWGRRFRNRRRRVLYSRPLWNVLLLLCPASLQIGFELSLFGHMHWNLPYMAEPFRS